MQHILRPYATAGAAIVGASLIAVTPMTASLPHVSRAANILLTAGDSQLGELMAPWIAQYNEAATSASQLANNFFAAPGVGLQQWLAVQSNLWQELLNDPSKAGDISDEMQENWKTLSTAFTLTNADDSVVQDVLPNTTGGESIGGLISLSHTDLFNMLPSFLPASLPADEIGPILNFLASPASAMIIGNLGPMISPLVALDNSITDGDDFNTTMANVVGAYFNGATLNLDSLIPLIQQADILPAGLDFSHLEFAFGGLLTPGNVSAPDLNIYAGDVDSSGDAVPLYTIPTVGGSIFNSLGLTLNGVPILGTLDLPGNAVGPIAAMEAWQQIIGNELGSGWNTGGGKNEPPESATPPGAGIHFPTIPTDYFGDDSGSGSAASLSTLLSDLFSSSDPSSITAQLTDFFDAIPGGDALAGLF